LKKIIQMDYINAKNKFIQTWGVLGSQWGINKTMAQIHALLYISANPLSMEEIMEELQISRGNASMNLRAIMEWGIVYKVTKPGERKEYFEAEKNLDELAVKVAKERSKREIKPVVKVLDELQKELDNTDENKYFIQQISELKNFVGKADNMIEKVTEFKDNFLTKLVMKLLK
jgi:DNA-binding transcriptional regulator GbsR (MarR family)